MEWWCLNVYKSVLLEGLGVGVAAFEGLQQCALGGSRRWSDLKLYNSVGCGVVVFLQGVHLCGFGGSRVRVEVVAFEWCTPLCVLGTCRGWSGGICRVYSSSSVLFFGR